MAPSRADLNSAAICKARHQVVFTKTDSNVASGSFAHCRIFESGRSAAILLTSLVEILQ